GVAGSGDRWSGREGLRPPTPDPLARACRVPREPGGRDRDSVCGRGRGRGDRPPVQGRLLDLHRVGQSGPGSARSRPAVVRPGPVHDAGRDRRRERRVLRPLGPSQGTVGTRGTGRARRPQCLDPHAGSVVPCTADSLGGHGHRRIRTGSARPVHPVLRGSRGPGHPADDGGAGGARAPRSRLAARHGPRHRPPGPAATEGRGLSSRASTVRRWRQVRRNPKIVTGVAILGLFVLVIVANPLLWATVWDGQERLYDPVIGFDHMIIHPSAPSGAHWLGTDSLGRDVTSMFTLAARSSVTVAVAAALVSGVVSLCLGSLAAYHRKWVDAVVTHTSDAMVLLPALLAVWVVGLGRPDASFGALQVGAVFGLVYGLGPATAAVRAAGLVVMARPFVEAARLVGAGGYWTMSRHLWPHLVPHAAVQAMIG